MQATVDAAVIGQWWEARPEANVILATGFLMFWTLRRHLALTVHVDAKSWQT
jgi:hypothetical protein